MALVVKDRVKVYSSTTGTGTLSLGSAFAGFQTFNNALADGDTTYYGIFESSTGNWEVGLGTYTSSGNTLSRDTILESSNAGAAVNLTADTEVFITYPAEKSVYFDANGDVNLNRDPQSALQAATKQYVDTIAAAGLHYHAPVRVEHPSNLTATYDNGTSGVGATLTNSGTQAVLVLDNVTMVVSDRVLIANQTNQAHNGVYTVTNIGSASTNWVLTRATDADSYGPSDPDALGEGDAFFIKEGDTNAGHLDVMTTSGTITFGTTNIVFSEVAETTVYSAGTGLSLSGTEFNVGAGTGITVDATTVNTVQDIATSATPTFDGLNTTGDITFGDSNKAIFGAGSDLQIWHDATNNSIIRDAGAGDLYIQASTNLRLTNVGGAETYAIFTENGAATLYYDNSAKIATSSSGISVTGTVTADGLTVDGTIDLNIGTENVGIDISSTDEGSYILVNDNNATGFYFGARAGSFDLYDTNNQAIIKANSNGDISFYEDTGTTAKFFWDASTMELGIGTNTPVNPLTVQQTSINWPYIALTNTSGTIKSQFGYQVNDDLLDIAANSGGIKFRTNNTETMRLTSAGNLGIGTSSPIEELDIVATKAGDFTGLRVHNADNTLASSNARLRLTTSTNEAWIAAYVGPGGSGYVTFGNENSEAMRIDSSGNLLVGITSAQDFTSTTTNGHTFYGASVNAALHSRNNANALAVQRTGTDGSLVNFFKDTTTVGSIGVYSGDITVGNGDVGLIFNDAVGLISPWDMTANAVEDNAIDLGYSAGRFKNLYLSGGVIGTAGARIYDSEASGSGLILSTGVIYPSGNTGATADGQVDLGSAGVRFKDLYLSNAIYLGQPSGTTMSYISDFQDDLYIFNKEAAGVMIFGTNNTERMRIDSSGNLIVSKTATSWNTEGIVLFSDASASGSRIDVTTDGGTPVNLNRLTSDGEIAGFYKDGITVGSIGSAAGSRLFIGNGDTGIRFAGGLDTIVPWNTNNSLRDAAIDLGEATGRFKDLYLSGSLSDGTTSRTVADIVGLTSSQFLRSDAADTATGLITFSGTSSAPFRLYASNASSTWDAVTFQATTEWGDSNSYGVLGGDGTEGLMFRKPHVVWNSSQGSADIRLGRSGGTSSGAWVNFGVKASNTGFIGYENTNVLTFSSTGISIPGTLNVSGNTTVSGILTTSGSSSGGVRIGSNSSGYPLLTTVSGVEFVIRDTDQIRFSDSTSWDYSAWAGIRYESGSNLMTIGGPSSSKFTSNAGPPDITINFDGLSGDDGLTYEGNPIWHDGNTWSVIDYVGDISTQNWNDYIDGSEASWARVLNMSGSNRPPNYTYGTALSISVASANKFQLYASHTGSSGNGLYFRTGWNTDYKGWAKIYDSVAHPALSYVDVATGSYGTIKVDDDRGVTWAGYAIRDDWVFMANGAAEAGIYNDTDNEWGIKFFQNGQTSLYYNGTAKLSTTSGGVAVTGAITATGDITAYFSDERLKDFDGKIEGALDKVSQLNGYYYRENDKAKELGFENDDRQVGVSAQEVEAVLPEVIKPAPVDPEYKTVQYEKLVPLLIEAIKELKEEVRQLKEDKA